MSDTPRTAFSIAVVMKSGPNGLVFDAVGPERQYPDEASKDAEEFIKAHPAAGLVFVADIDEQVYIPDPQPQRRALTRVPSYSVKEEVLPG